MIPSPIGLFEAAGQEAFKIHLKPKLAKLLCAIGLDVVYSRAEGDYLYYHNDVGDERQVLDMVGGFGTTLFGHNHPALVGRAIELLTTQRPFMAQGSIRSYAGLLAERLSQMVGRSTSQSYVVTLANSGAEAVEAALKHASFERQQRIEKILAAQERTFKSIRLAVSNGEIIIPDDMLTEAERQLDVPDITSLESLEHHLLRHQQQVLGADSQFLAIKGAFHGKTTGALKLTHNPEFRTPWSRLGIQSRFIPRNDADSLRQAIDTAQVYYYELTLSPGGTLRLESRAWYTVVACLIEPIQGEGGIHELSPSFMRALRAAADRIGCPLIIDEIQSGMGRTGTFLASEAGDVRGDYYLFSKSLGGGLAKVSALLVQQDRYREEFGYLHTSTFADDDFSSAIALGALELVEANGGALMQSCAQKGDYLLTQLNKVRERYPHVIKEIRGRGLMIGIELSPQLDSPSTLLRVASEQKLLGFLLCGYLFNEAGIRIMPAISANNTIRLEPSAYVTYEALDRFCQALEEAVSIIDRADACGFVRFMAGDLPVEVNIAHQFQPTQAKSQHRQADDGSISRKVACIAHFMNPEDLLHWDPNLAPLPATACTRLLDKASEIMEPFIASKNIIVSPTGERISLTVIGIPLTAAQIMTRLRNGSADAVISQIELGLELAKQLGCSQVGFTGYTSIATNNCLTLVEDKVGLTSGNSMTAAAAIEATHQAAQDMGIDIQAARLGVVGGVGNIGRVLAEIEVDTVASILLVGRPGAQRRLIRLAETLYARAWQQVMRGNADHGLARFIRQSGLADQLKRLSDPQTAGSVIYQTLTYELEDAAPIQISTDMADLRSCDLIISATNSPEPIIGPQDIGPQPTLICDVSVPSDVTPDLTTHCPHARVIKGGIIQLPQGQALSIPGMALEEGQLFACLTETVLLGLSGFQNHFSYGPLQAERVRQIGKMAKQHQFTVMVKEAA